MKQTVVPAQVTTVEDKIAGSLSLSQLLLLMAPLFIGGAIYAVFLPNFKLALYKIVIIGLLSFMCAIAAIRIKGQLVLFWMTKLIRYTMRPRYYVFDKNDAYLRESLTAIPQQAKEPIAEKPKKKRLHKLPHLPTAELVKVEEFIINPQANLSFKADKKGGLRVHYTEVK